METWERRTSLPKASSSTSQFRRFFNFTPPRAEARISAPSEYNYRETLLRILFFVLALPWCLLQAIYHSVASLGEVHEEQV